MDIILVNIPKDSAKKSYDEAFPFKKSLNFGILAIASYLKNKNYRASVFDPQVAKTTDPLSELCSLVQREKPTTIGLSCISGFGYATFKKYALKLRKEFPHVLILGGGQNHIGILGKTVLEECPTVDLAVKGEGEWVVEEVIRSLKTGVSFQHIPNVVYRDSLGKVIETSLNDSNLTPIPKLDYSLYPEFRVFPPAVEVSRGCPYHCAFCSSIQKTLRKKNPADIIAEVENIVSHYKTASISIYFQAPVFLHNDSEIAELMQLREQRQLNFTWRAETRVEYLVPKRIPSLFSSGMRVVDVGLESASPVQLKRMNKTPNPSQYLQTMSRALPILHELGLIAKLNILFYLGENVNTLRETYSFLENTADNVQALSAYPLLLYPGSCLFNSPKEIRKFGGTIVTDSNWINRHLNPVNPSLDFTYQQLDSVGITLGKCFQNMKTFFKQQSQGYYSPQTTYEEFEACALNYKISRLPFSRTTEEMMLARSKLARIIRKNTGTN